jgi:hypothetical protein
MLMLPVVCCAMAHGTHRFLRLDRHLPGRLLSWAKGSVVATTLWCITTNADKSERA